MLPLLGILPMLVCAVLVELKQHHLTSSCLTFASDRPFLLLWASPSSSHVQWLSHLPKWPASSSLFLFPNCLWLHTFSFESCFSSAEQPYLPTLFHVMSRLLPLASTTPHEGEQLAFWLHFLDHTINHVAQ